MQQKVTNCPSIKTTSYEISKRLHELGYGGDDCPVESHCGWWGIPDWDVVMNLVEYIDPAKEDDLVSYRGVIKAYDCWDLLMWLASVNKSEINPLNLELRQDRFIFDVPWLDDFIEAESDEHTLTDILGLAVIKILEEKENGT